MNYSVYEKIGDMISTIELDNIDKKFIIPTRESENDQISHCVISSKLKFSIF